MLLFCFKKKKKGIKTSKDGEFVVGGKPWLGTPSGARVLVQAPTPRTDLLPSQLPANAQRSSG